MDRTLKVEDCYTILSSGKSGTSCFGKMLVDSGMPRGEATWKTDKFKRGSKKSRAYEGINGKGEHKAVYTFHNKILADNDLTWGTPADPSEIEIDTKYYDAFGKIITTVGFFKDPRTILFIEEWWKKYPNIKALGLFRHPYLTINSINGKRKSKEKEEYGKNLYIFYYNLLLKLHKKYKFPLLEFGGETYLEEFTSLCGDLNLTPNTSLYTYGGKKVMKGNKKYREHPWAIPTNKEFGKWSQEADDLYEELKERKTYQ